MTGWRRTRGRRSRASLRRPTPRCTRIGAVEAELLSRGRPERSTSASATAEVPVRAHGSARRHAARGSATPFAFSPAAAIASSTSNRAAAAESRRRLRSFSRQRRSSLRIGGGRPGRQRVPVRLLHHDMRQRCPRYFVTAERPSSREHLVEHAPNAQSPRVCRRHGPLSVQGSCRPPCRGSPHVCRMQV